MAVSSPRDKYFGVWLIFFILGLGTLLPWNFFMTATMYFTSRLKDSSLVHYSANQTEAADEHRSVLEAKFNNVMTLCAMLPLLLCTCLNSFLHSLIPQRLRVMGSLIIIMFVFIATAILVKLPLEPLPFFSITMVKIVIINSFGAVLQGSLFGMAGLLPASYTTPIMSGQGLAGTFAAFAMICAITSGSELHDAAFGYFITACVVIFLSILSYILLPRLEFFQFHQDRNRKERADKDNSVNLMNRENNDEAADQNKQRVPMIEIFKKIWLLALSVCFTFTVTIGTFPAITADTKSTLADGGLWATVRQLCSGNMDYDWCTPEMHYCPSDHSNLHHRIIYQLPSEQHTLERGHRGSMGDGEAFWSVSAGEPANHCCHQSS